MTEEKKCDHSVSRSEGNRYCVTCGTEITRLTEALGEANRERDEVIEALALAKAENAIRPSYTRLQAELFETLAKLKDTEVALAEAKAQNDYPLPCHVLLPPATRIGPGVPLSVLVTAVKQRDGRNVGFGSAFKALDDLTAAQATIGVLREALEDAESTIQALRNIPPNPATQMIVDESLRIISAALASPAEKEG